MDEKLLAKLDELYKKAQAVGKSHKATSSRNRSSLSQVIKTKEQAAVFMKLLKSA